MFHRASVSFAATVLLIACGSPDPEPMPTPVQPSSAAQARPDALPRVAAAPPAAMPAPAAGLTATSPPESAQCLDLVEKAKFQEAVPVCVRAAGLDPENTAVKQALETARTEAAAAALGSSPQIPSAGKDMAAGAVGGNLP